MTPCMEIILRLLRATGSSARWRAQHPEPAVILNYRVDWTTWWLWRGARTRSHPELGRENPQRPWYCVSRHGRVGRRQVFQSTRHSINAAGFDRMAILGLNPRTYARTGALNCRGVEQPGSSSGS